MKSLKIRPEYARTAKAMLAVPPAAISGLLMALLPGTIWQAEMASLIACIAFFQMVTSILALNSNYVFMTRYPRLTVQERNSEFGFIMSFRLVVGICTVVAMYFYSMLEGRFVFFIALYLISKLLHEIQLNKLRAASEQDMLLIWCWIFYGTEAIIITFCFFSVSQFGHFIMTISIFSIILAGLWCLMCARHIYVKQVASFPLKDYLLTGAPLMLSSVREGLMGPGLIAVAAQIMPSQNFLSFNLLVRVVRVGSLIFSALSNFYFQDMSRGVNNKSSLALVFLVVTLFYMGLFPLYLFASDLFSFPTMSLDGVRPTLLLGVCASIYMAAFYSVVQFKWIIEKQFLYVTIFEICSIFVVAAALYMAQFTAELLWFSGSLGFLIPLVILVTISRFKRGNKNEQSVG